MASKFLIYALVDPRTKQWRYIGKSCSGLERPRGHAGKASRERTRKAMWIRSLQAAGLTFEIEILETHADGSRLYDAEQEWIARAREAGIPLTNGTDGGPGCLGRKASDETREAIRLGNLGRKHSPETIERLRRSHLGAKLKPESIAKRTAARAGYRHSDETRAKMTGRKRSAEARRNMSMAMKGRTLSEERRRQISETQKGRKLKPESIAKRTETARRNRLERNTGADV